MKREKTRLVFSPSDLVRYLASPFASWMDRYNLEHPGEFKPDERTEDEQLVAEFGDKHERAALDEYKRTTPDLVEIRMSDSNAFSKTQDAIASRAPIIYQAALEAVPFAGYADFLVLGASGRYEVWDTKLARSIKPYFPIQLCAYSEMLAAATGEMPERFGIILGNGEHIELRVEDFIHYYRRVKADFLDLQERFTGRIEDRPEPLPRADHGRWASYAEEFFASADHLVRVAGITVGQMRRLHNAGITTMAALASGGASRVEKLAPEILKKLAAQARLQRETGDARKLDPSAPPCYELLPMVGAAGEPVGLASLPAPHPADVFFDMEGYPLVDGGLEYLFGATLRAAGSEPPEFKDWWAHDRAGEKLAFEGFVDWAHARWKANPGMHIYHYASYEVSAVRRLSTRHDTRQDAVDDLLRNEVFVDLYQTVRHAVRVGEDSYSIKSIERLYRPPRTTDVATAAQSIVEYNRWMESGEARDWQGSPILNAIRDYNEDDCKSTAELLGWLNARAREQRIDPRAGEQRIDPRAVVVKDAEQAEEAVPSAAAIRAKAAAENRAKTVDELRKRPDAMSATLADLVDYHRREEKPMWWLMFERAKATPEKLHDDTACIEGVEAVGAPFAEKRSLVQAYRFDANQDCKWTVGAPSTVMFSHQLDAALQLVMLDTRAGELHVKLGKQSLDAKLGGAFPPRGSLIPKEVIPTDTIAAAVTDVSAGHLTGTLGAPAASLLSRRAPAPRFKDEEESTVDAATRVAASMSGGCLVIQGPPGTGKTYTAAHMIDSLISMGKRVGVTSNSHKAILKLFRTCAETTATRGGVLSGVKAAGDGDDPFFTEFPSVAYVEKNENGRDAYTDGIVGGTAWLFCRPEWIGALDFLFIDEAGQVSLANAVAMSRCASNLVLLGDQMQLEQPVKGSHPGDAGLSALQYALKNTELSREDAPVFHAVVPANLGLFLGETRRMHPDVCRFISESIYEGRLGSHIDCARQRIAMDSGTVALVAKETGIVFSGVEHDGNVQQSDEEVARVKAIYAELLGRIYTPDNGPSRPLSLEDFLFIAPYNAQVRALESALPGGARVGSVDGFQGQEAPVCILSLCSSFGEYGSRGLSFILDRNRINVAISRAKCLAVVVADPRIAATAAGSIGEMRLLNLFCKLLSGPSHGDS